MATIPELTQKVTNFKKSPKADPKEVAKATKALKQAVAAFEAQTSGRDLTPEEKQFVAAAKAASGQ